MGSIWDSLSAVAGTYFSQQANNQAVDVANEASQRGLQAEIDSVNQYIAANYEGLGVQRDTANAAYDSQVASYDQLYGENELGMRFLRQVLANPSKLTDDQRRQVEEARRVTGENIRGSGYGGSGRTAAAMMGKVEGDMVSGMLANNRTQAMQIAAPMADRANEAIIGKAGAAGELGRSMQGIYGGYYDRYGTAVTSVGKSTANAINTQGNNVAGGITANAKLSGQAIGDISAAINNGARESRYADRMATYEKSLNL